MIPQLRRRVRPEWIDANEHLSEAYYVLVFGEATEHAMAHVGMTPEYREREKCSLFTVEAHLRYLDQVVLGEEVTVTTQVTEVGGKRLVLWHEMSAGGRMRATAEIVGVHVDLGAVKAKPLPDQVRIAAERLLAPEKAGR
ncbi:thioesterase family protein [Amycolatopsis jejuensis]|uniref:thioesterase family protein n=1 Tax=Amycolatopsis jejuensis TaxID=330084 RepID=UPI000B1F40DD|nr:thioesterase family protein [Amycolatopsis jejuensis]